MERFSREPPVFTPAPYHIYPGQKLKADAVIGRLQRAGFEPEGSNHAGAGTYELAKGRILTIKPSSGDAMQLRFDGNALGRDFESKNGRG